MSSKTFRIYLYLYYHMIFFLRWTDYVLHMKISRLPRQIHYSEFNTNKRHHSFSIQRYKDQMKRTEKRHILQNREGPVTKYQTILIAQHLSNKDGVFKARQIQLSSPSSIKCMNECFMQRSVLPVTLNIYMAVEKG